MLVYIAKRIVMMIPMLIAISMISFTIIQLPPGDYLTSYMATLAASGDAADEALLAALRAQYGLDRPIWVQYLKWVWGILHLDFGYSFEWNRPVSQLIGERLALSVAVSFLSLMLSWVIAFPIGIYSAVRQYSLFDYLFTFLGFIGLAVPNFMVALVLMFLSYRYLGVSVGGLFSPEYLEAAWSWAKFVDLLKHVWIPMVIIATGGTAQLIRIMRANLLDELQKPYVVTARARGVNEFILLMKYPVRVAINPFISTVGWTLPQFLSGEAITAVVLSMPTTGPLLLRALMSQDMYLAGSFVMILAFLTVIGTLISDFLLAWSDPRIRYE